MAGAQVLPKELTLPLLAGANPERQLLGVDEGPNSAVCIALLQVKAERFGLLKVFRRGG